MAKMEQIQFLSEARVSSTPTTSGCARNIWVSTEDSPDDSVFEEIACSYDVYGTLEGTPQTGVPISRIIREGQEVYGTAFSVRGYALSNIKDIKSLQFTGWIGTPSTTTIKYLFLFVKDYDGKGEGIVIDNFQDFTIEPDHEIALLTTDGTSFKIIPPDNSEINGVYVFCFPWAYDNYEAIPYSLKAERSRNVNDGDIYIQYGDADTSIKIKVLDTWKTTTKAYQKVNGEWKAIVSMSVKIDGEYKVVHLS